MSTPSSAAPSSENGGPLYPNPPMPVAGQQWRSKDKRDKGLTVKVLDVENGFVRIQRFRKTTVSLGRFHREYEPVESALDSEHD